jgi:hypothetical protein
MKAGCFPLIPAHAGIQSLANELDARVRGHERSAAVDYPPAAVFSRCCQKRITRCAE